MDKEDRCTVFSRIHSSNGWDCSETISGKGSTICMTALIRERLPIILQWLNVNSLLDLPCGDFHWMSSVPLEGRVYIGADIVPSIVHQNIEQHGDTGTRQFLILDGIDDSLPKVDLILCRDLVIHLPNEDVLRLLKNFVRSGSKYLLLTRFLVQYGHIPINGTVEYGGFRAVDPCLAPFNLPPPIVSLPESQGPYKTLGLWELNTLKSL